MTITTRSPGASGCLFVVAAPSGGGKSSMVNALLEREPGIRLSVSYTTRPPRPGESEGNHYHFVDVPRFLALKETSATWLRSQVGAGQDVLLEIDWQGAAQVRRLMPDSVHIFILPPSIEALKERLTKRAQDPPAVIEQRLTAAREEMSHCGEFDYVIMNQEFARAVDDLSVIVRAARLTAPRQQVRHAKALAALLNPDY